MDNIAPGARGVAALPAARGGDLIDLLLA